MLTELQLLTLIFAPISGGIVFAVEATVSENKYGCYVLVPARRYTEAYFQKREEKRKEFLRENLPHQMIAVSKLLERQVLYNHLMIGRSQ